MLFPTEGAMALGVSELQLLLSSPDSTYLGTACRELLGELHTLHEIESIVRNEFAVHEKQGKFINLKLGDNMGIAMSETAGDGALDLRFFMKHWQHILAIKSTDPNRPSHAIAFFDGLGQAINKVFLRDNSQDAISVWQNLVDKYAKDAPRSLTINQAKAQGRWQKHLLDDEQKANFHQDWHAMSDIHQFHGVLTKYQLDRASSYHQAPDGMAIQLSPKAIESLLQRLADEQIGVMVFVGNTGIIQIHADTICTIKRLGNWLNILDSQHSQFTLHLNDSALTQLWYIKRPHLDGFTSAIEGFDAKGNSIITFFGTRQGSAQDTRWQTLTATLADEFVI